MRSVILVLRQSIKAIDGYTYLTLYHQASRVVMWRVACPHLHYPSEASFLSHSSDIGRNARAPSAARTGSASVSLAWKEERLAWRLHRQARLQKTYPFKRFARGTEQARFTLPAGGILRRGLSNKSAVASPPAFQEHRAGNS
jgi:hypothetical protein